MAYSGLARESIRGSVILLIGNLLSTMILALSAIVIARLLGPDLYGTYTLALLIPSIFQVAIGFGINTAITKYSAYYISLGKIEMAQRIARNATLVVILFGTLLAIITYSGASFFAVFVFQRSQLTPLIQLSSWFLIGHAVLQSSVAGFIGWNSLGLSSVSMIVQSLMKFILSTLLILLGFGLFGAILAHVASYLLSGTIAILIFYVLRLRDKNSIHGNFFNDMKTVVSYGLPLLVGNLVTAISLDYVIVVLSLISNNTTVGYYQAALNLTVPISIVSSSIAISLFTSFSKLEGSSDGSLILKYAVKYVSYLVTPIIVFLAASSGMMLRIFYGQSYVPGAIYLVLLLLSYIPISIGLNVIPSFLNGVGKTKFTMVILLSGGVTLLTVAPVLGIYFNLGVFGLIFSLFISNMVVAGLGLLICSKYLYAKINFKSSAGVLVASLISYLIIFMSSSTQIQSPIVMIPDLIIFGISYLTMAPLLRVIELSDIHYLSVSITGIGLVGKLVKLILAYESYLLSIVAKSD